MTLKKINFCLLLSALLILGAAGSAFSDSEPTFKTAFPDPVFRDAAMNELSASSENEALSAYRDKLSAVDALSVSGLGISSLEGIANFPNLVYLDCGGNKLKSLLVGSLSKLTDLICGGNQLTELDVSKQLKLVSLFAEGNALETLVLPKGGALAYLDISDNLLTNIALSESGKLYMLNANNNRLSRLSLIGAPLLGALYTDSNRLTCLDLSGNAKLSTVFLGSQNAVAEVMSNGDGTYTFRIESTGIVTNISDGSVKYEDGSFILSEGSLDDPLEYQYVPTGGFVMDVTVVTAGSPPINSDKLPGDLTGDNLVNSADLTILLSAYGTHDETNDLTGDGLINSADLTLLLSNYGSRK